MTTWAINKNIGIFQILNFELLTKYRLTMSLILNKRTLKYITQEFKGSINFEADQSR